MTTEGARFQPRRAIRCIFEYEGEQLRLLTQQTVEMVVADTSPTSADAPGYYLDARDSSERTLARVAAHGAFSRSTEVFPERHEEPIARIDVPQQRGAFTVTLPAVEEADHVTLVRIVRVVEGAERGAGLERIARVVDVASFPLSRR
jgi:hypothetical protein